MNSKSFRTIVYGKGTPLIAMRLYCDRFYMFADPEHDGRERSEWRHSGAARGECEPRGYPKRPCMGVYNPDKVQKSPRKFQGPATFLENILLR